MVYILVRFKHELIIFYNITMSKRFTKKNNFKNSRFNLSNKLSINQNEKNATLSNVTPQNEAVLSTESSIPIAQKLDKSQLDIKQLSKIPKLPKTSRILNTNSNKLTTNQEQKDSLSDMDIEFDDDEKSNIVISSTKPSTKTTNELIIPEFLEKKLDNDMLASHLSNNDKSLSEETDSSISDDDGGIVDEDEDVVDENGSDVGEGGGGSGRDGSDVGDGGDGDVGDGGDGDGGDVSNTKLSSSRLPINSARADNLSSKKGQVKLMSVESDDVTDANKQKLANSKLRFKKIISKVSNFKKGPGRPRKTPKKEPIPRKGISKHPANPDSFIEVLYDQPIVIKKIFQFFKAIAAAQIQIIFRPKDIIFYAVDHLEKSRIRVKIDATKLNNYYCRDILDVGVSTKEMELILNKIDKEYSCIILLSDISSTQRNITLVLENDIQIDEMHRIELIGQYNKMENERLFIDEDYTIKFEFPSKYFKKTINDIKTMSLQLSITQEDSESPIVFEYLTENKRIQSKHTVKDGKKIKLESYLSDDKSFRVDVRIDYIKPIAASQIADEIKILVDENKSFMTIAYIDDGSIEIKTLTEIIDERPDEDD